MSYSETMSNLGYVAGAPSRTAAQRAVSMSETDRKLRAHRWLVVRVTDGALLSAGDDLDSALQRASVIGPHAVVVEGKPPRSRRRG